MLNELHALAGTLSAMQIQTQEWHPEYKEIPNVTAKDPCFRLWVTEQGVIDSASTISADIALNIRKFGNNQATFPAFNLVPLYRLTNAQHKEGLKQILAGKAALDVELIKSWCSCDNWHNQESKLPDINKKAFACVASKSEHLQQAFAQTNAQSAALTALIEAAKPWSAEVTAFRAALEECVFRHLQSADNPELYCKILFHLGEEAKPHKNDRGKLSLVLDLANWQQFGFPIAHEQTTSLINRVLLAYEANAAAKSNTTAAAKSDLPQAKQAYDAFGSSFSEVGKPMPSVKLKGFEVTLRAMFNAQACQYRYGKIDDASYPITRSNRSAAQSSLEWIADAARQGQTWQHSDKNEIVFAYPSTLPEIPLNLTDVFTQMQAASGSTEATFAETAGKVIAALRALPPEQQPENIHVFCLRKMDKARTKVILNRNCSPAWLIHSAEEWQKGCTNLPPLHIRAWPATAKGTKAEKDEAAEKVTTLLLEPITPYPLELPRIVNNVWKQNGELAQGKAEAKCMDNYQGIELLLDAERQPAAQHYLSTMLSHSTGLVQHVADVLHRGLALSNKRANDTLMLLSAIALLLHKCGCKKGDYMQNTAYQVGQMFKISDELHAFYCQIVRKGDIPPQLAGSSAFVRAGNMPAQALAYLRTRMNPYISWAKSYRLQNAPQSWKAHWLLSLYEEAANSLRDLPLDARFTTLEKAQLFIGYLADFPKRESNKAEKAKADAASENAATNSDVNSDAINKEEK